MIPALIALFAVLFGVGGDADYFYIDGLDKGIKKYVDDKDLKKEAMDTVKAFVKFRKEQQKAAKTELKQLEMKNEDRTATAEWFDDFFGRRMEAKIEMQERWIRGRLWLQENIRTEDWDEIMAFATKTSDKINEKEAKKEAKGKHKDVFAALEAAITQSIVDPAKQSKVMTGLEVFEKQYYEIGQNLKDINVTETDFLKDQNTTAEQLVVYGKLINDQREDLFKAYALFYFVGVENTTAEEWKPIAKHLNKILKG